MHELSIAQNILDIVRQHLPSDGRQKVRVVKVRVGDMASVVPESLEFCFNAIIAETSFEGASLIIEHVPVVIRCTQCGKENSLANRMFYCPSCTSPDVQMISGNELQVVEIEVSDESMEVE